MKRIYITLSCAFIIGTVQLSAMKRPQNQITNAPEIEQKLWLPSEVITKIAATCDPAARTNLALTNKYLNACASIKNNNTIVHQPEFTMAAKNRLYYLFYGCIHNLKNLVQYTLKKFDPEIAEIDRRSGQCSYPDKKLLNEAKYYIEQLTNSDSAKLLPCYPDVTINLYDWTIFDFAGYQKDVQLFNLCIEDPKLNHLLAMPSCIAQDLNIDDLINEGYMSGSEKEHLAMLKILLIHNRYSADQWAQRGKGRSVFYVWSTCSLSAAKLFLDYDKVNDINRSNSHEEIFGKGNSHEEIPNNAFNDGQTLLHYHTELPKIIKLLLTHPEINVNIQNRDGNAPLHNAVGDHVTTIKILLAHPDIDLNIQNNNGNTPLHKAAHSSNHYYLLDNGEFVEDNSDDIPEPFKLLCADPRTNINLQNKDGETPLHTAVKNEYFNSKIVERLLADPRINVSIPNEEGISPIQYMLNTKQSLLDKLNNAEFDSEIAQITQQIIEIDTLIERAIQIEQNDAMEQTLIEYAQVDSYFT